MVKNGGSLVIDGGVVNQADIHVKGGGKLTVINGGYLIRGEDDVLETDMDGQVIWEEGTVNNM